MKHSIQGPSEDHPRTIQGPSKDPVGGVQGYSPGGHGGRPILARWRSTAALITTIIISLVGSTGGTDCLGRGGEGWTHNLECHSHAHRSTEIFDRADSALLRVKAAATQESLNSTLAPGSVQPITASVRTTIPPLVCR